MKTALCIAIVGAESTGKTTLAAALATQLASISGLRVTWVPEALRGWCERAGRTPLKHEQSSILRLQQEAIDNAASMHDVVVCDTAPLMTAVYSRVIFGDRSLDARAVQLQRRMGLTLLTALDLPWVADGLQRDGPHVQGPVDDALRELLLTNQLPFSVLAGVGEARLEAALAASAPLVFLAGRTSIPTSGGLFRRLVTESTNPADSGNWSCQCCVPEAERALRHQGAG